jgi:hypothetical protein
MSSPSFQDPRFPHILEGVFVRDVFFKFDSDEIFLNLVKNNVLTDNDVKDLLEALIQGKFTRVKKIEMWNLEVSCFWTCWFLVPLEGDAFCQVDGLSSVTGERLAQALKTNSTVRELYLVG